MCEFSPLDTVCLTQLLCSRIHTYSRWAVLVKGRSDFRNQFLQSFLSITSFGFPLLFGIVYQTCFWQPPCYSFLKKWVLVCKELLTLSIPFMRKRRTANKLYCKIHMLKCLEFWKKLFYKLTFSWNNLDITKLINWRQPNKNLLSKFWNWVCYHIGIYIFHIIIYNSC